LVKDSARGGLTCFVALGRQRLPVAEADARDSFEVVLPPGRTTAIFSFSKVRAPKTPKYGLPWLETTLFVRERGGVESSFLKRVVARRVIRLHGAAARFLGFLGLRRRASAVSTVRHNGLA